MKALLFALLLAPALATLSAAEQAAGPRSPEAYVRDSILARADLNTKIADSISTWLERTAGMTAQGHAPARPYAIEGASQAPCYGERVEMDDKIVGSCVLKVHAFQTAATVVVSLDDSGELTAQPLQVTVE